MEDIVIVVTMVDMVDVMIVMVAMVDVTMIIIADKANDKIDYYVNLYFSF